MKQLEAGDVEAKVLARIAKKGIDIIEKDIAKCNKVLASTTVKSEAKSIMQRQWVVFLACRDVLAQRADDKKL
jgi:hypothetical protein